MIKGGVVLVTDKYKRLPFFHNAGNNTFVPKPLVYERVDHVRMQVEFCKFVGKYYKLVRDGFEVVNVGGFDFLFNRMFLVDERDEFNVFALLNSALYNKLCDGFDVYSYVDFMVSMYYSPFRYRVGDSFVVLPLDLVDKGSDKLFNSLPKDLSRVGEKKVVNIVRRIFNEVFSFESPVGKVYFSNIILVYPMIKYSLFVTTRGRDVSGLLFEFDGFEDGVYTVKPVNGLLKGLVNLVDDDIGDSVWGVHFDDDFVIVGGKKFKFESVEFHNNIVIVNGVHKVKLEKNTGIRNFRIVSY